MKTFSKCKRLLASLLAILMIVQLGSVTVFAEESETPVVQVTVEPTTTETPVAEETLPTTNPETTDIPGGGIN